MNDGRLLAAIPAAAPLRPRVVLEALHGITRENLQASFLLGILLFTYHLGTQLAVDDDLPGMLVIFVADQIKVFPVMLAFIVADRVTGKNPDRRAAHVLAVIVGSALGAAAAVTFVTTMANTFWHPARVHPEFVAYVGLEIMLLGSAATWLILDRRRAESSRVRLQSAEDDRIAAQKRSIESDLQAMQARVEPQFLFNTLAQVRQLYEQHPDRGEHMLDELIAYLRAAMPLMRDTSSTLGQEIELARAYLSIVKVRLGDRLQFDIEMPEGIGNARMPPMMLLPLVDHAVAHGLAESQENGVICIRTTIVDGKVRLEIADSGVGFLPEHGGDGIDGIRERLASLYATRASLVLGRGKGHATAALMEIPLEVTEPGAS